jgi:hypothetical protein
MVAVDLRATGSQDIRTYSCTHGGVDRKLAPRSEIAGDLQRPKQASEDYAKITAAGCAGLKDAAKGLECNDAGHGQNAFRGGVAARGGGRVALVGARAWVAGEIAGRYFVQERRLGILFSGHDVHCGESGFVAAGVAFPQVNRQLGH